MIPDDEIKRFNALPWWRQVLLMVARQDPWYRRARLNRFHDLDAKRSKSPEDQ